MRAVIIVCLILALQLPPKAVEAAVSDDENLRDEVDYLKLNTLKQLENLNTKMEWGITDRLSSNGGNGGRVPTSLIAKDCAQIQENVLKYRPLDSLQSGVYGIAVGGRERPVFCDFTTNGGGWTLIQRRIDDSVGFNRTWAQYKKGFGNAAGNFWLGNEQLYKMTNGTTYSLRIDMWNWENKHSFAQYSQFRVGPESDHYRLYVFGFSGMVRDSLMMHNNKPFTTYDKYGHGESNCPKKWGGGWWFKNCYHAFFNGRISNEKTLSWKRSQWKDTGSWTVLKRVEMKLRPINFGSM